MRESADLYREFRDKEYAQAYIEDFTNTYLATQIKVLREQRGLTQAELGDLAGMKQTRISLVENVDYSAWSIKTLRRIATAFDLRLKVSFETFSSGIVEVENFSRESLKRESRTADIEAHGKSQMRHEEAPEVLDRPVTSAAEEHFRGLTRYRPMSVPGAHGLGSILSSLREQGFPHATTPRDIGARSMAFSNSRPESDRRVFRATST